jgi:hypothetical protein
MFVVWTNRQTHLIRNVNHVGNEAKDNALKGLPELQMEPEQFRGPKTTLAL